MASKTVVVIKESSAPFLLKECASLLFRRDSFFVTVEIFKGDDFDGDDGVAMIFTSLRATTHLKQVKLNKIFGKVYANQKQTEKLRQSIETLVKFLRSDQHRITELEIASNSLGNCSQQVFKALEKSKRFLKVNLSQNDFSDTDAAWFGRFVHSNQTVEEIWIENNQFTKSGWRTIQLGLMG